MKRSFCTYLEAIDVNIHSGLQAFITFAITNRNYKTTIRTPKTILDYARKKLIVTILTMLMPKYLPKRRQIPFFAKIEKFHFQYC